MRQKHSTTTVTLVLTGPTANVTERVDRLWQAARADPLVRVRADFPALPVIQPAASRPRRKAAKRGE